MHVEDGRTTRPLRWSTRTALGLAVLAAGCMPFDQGTGANSTSTPDTTVDVRGHDVGSPGLLPSTEFDLVPHAEIGAPAPDQPPHGRTCAIDNAGLGRGQHRRCVFIALAPGTALLDRDQPATGGTEAAPTRTTVRVTRDGVLHTWHLHADTTRARPDGTTACAPDVQIRTGDRVEAEIIQSDDGSDPARVLLAVGADTTCD